MYIKLDLDRVFTFFVGFALYFFFYFYLTIFFFFYQLPFFICGRVNLFRPTFDEIPIDVLM